ncbi:alkanesulfonate monooxygenase SsuD/methylene tetrahydromethanopterin reductase-like flavin-dependent oxidoreductase (luciferase family) [Pseudonocardia sediminis]|uniref:Alkanesulfonate monooxygenase SsuD/methylene tetrahydromethanopterin reductase-like flavin-dependent oxidoreductase (Luciferase family) n=1 Tax=Pseudonocardia sediminis TaxID=1397368 RepID=A0A4Q7UVD2_PSEST|nr:LLM class flavin-dependent oxidoreductase [Pseudonocardia sediminis]RZT85004.1 alkanesulfonate monooxygenase SsuD/methylene tetrahydromethanopterin reductase-like flavin-dependent oxidoreductase (luciferase family) [Pseudonocardia sediminis]
MVQTVTHGREKTLPLEHTRTGPSIFNDQKMKLGLFGSNCSGGLCMTEAETTYEITWDHTKSIAQKADRLGMEAMVPVARWKGFGGNVNFNGTNFETFTWAAGLAEATEQITIFTTTHIPTVHPIVAANMAVTNDHIASGRYGLNLVMGWFTPEMQMFNPKQLEHDERYVYGGEWLEFVERLWTAEGEFDFDGKYFQSTHCESEPKPFQNPRPVLINAGNSPSGTDFSAKYCDINFASLDIEKMGDYTKAIKAKAREEYQRRISTMTYGLVVCRDTEAEAKRVHQDIIDKGDWPGARNLMSIIGMESQSFNEQIEKFQERFIAGWAGMPLVGTPEQIVDGFQELSDAGMEGMIMGFLDYNEELDYFGEAVMPLMREAGLRY